MSTGKQKIALITGASRRIGAAIAQKLHSREVNLILHYRNSGIAAEQLAADLNRQRSGSVTLLQADFEQPGELEMLVDTVQERHGRLDVLVNNASAFEPTPVGKVSQDDWDHLMASNLRAPFFLSQALLPLLAANQGCIVNLVDIHAQRPLKDYSVYCIAKAGLLMMTLSLARELGPQVRVNGVAPGSILWPEMDLDDAAKKAIIERTALKRRGEPEDIATAVAYLALDALYVTGEILTVDGGRSLNM
jgi:pteridine reductase